MNRRMDEAWFPPYLCFHSESGQDLPCENDLLCRCLLTDKTEAEIHKKISKVYIVSPECFLMQVSRPEVENNSYWPSDKHLLCRAGRYDRYKSL